MPKTTGLGDNFYVGGFDLSGDVASVDTLSSPVELINVTTLTFRAYQRLGGKRDGTMSFTSFMDTNFPTISTPGFPASTTPVLNTFPYTIYATITGGTLTNVLVNGVSVGTTAGTYAVPVNGTISITYSVAPTWSWFARGTEHNALAGLPTADIVSSYFQGTSVGNPAASMTSKQVGYDPTRDSSANLTLKVDMTANGFGLEWGKQLTAGLRTDNGATTGAFFDSGVAAGAWGCQAYLHLVELVGTNVDVTVTHATTSGGSYTTLVDFGSQTAIGSFRQVVANTTQVNQFLKVATAGTFTQAVVAGNFVKNQTAGVTF